MSLFDGQLSPTDALFLGLLGGTSSNFGENALKALSFQQAIMGQQDRRKHDALQQQMMAAQLEQLQRAQARQQQLDALGPKFMSNTSPEGPTPPTMDWGGYMNALTGIDPMKGLALQAQMAELGKKERATLKPGETIGSYVGGQFHPEYTAPDKTKTPEIGKTREIESGDKKFTYEWDGKEWKKIAEAPRFQPEKPPAPQLYDGPSGPVWVQPPGRGQGGSAVTGPDGKPMGPKVGQDVKNDIAKIDSELQIIEGAKKAVTSSPSAFGMGRGLATMAGAIPESIAGRTDTPDERQSRSYVFNVVSKVINERAGAAQSKQELARLRSFLPAETDAPEQIMDKFTAFENYLKERKAGLAGSGSQPGNMQSGPVRRYNLATGKIE